MIFVRYKHLSAQVISAPREERWRFFTGGKNVFRKKRKHTPSPRKTNNSHAPTEIIRNSCNRMACTYYLFGPSRNGSTDIPLELRSLQLASVYCYNSARNLFQHDLLRVFILLRFDACIFHIIVIRSVRKSKTILWDIPTKTKSIIRLIEYSSP